MLRGLVGGALLTGALLGALVVPAAAQVDSREGIALQNQILELRRDLQGLEAQRGGGGGYAPAPVTRGGGGGDISAQLLDRVSNLEDQVRRLQGQLDEQANASRRAQDDLAKQIGDLNFKLQNGGPAAAGTGAAQTSPAVAPPAFAPPTQPSGPVRRPPELAMQEGNAALARRDYPAAQAAAREVLANPRGPRAQDADFLLAQALAGSGDWRGAAIAYDDAYNRARTGTRAPDALLGIANAMLSLNDKAAACASVDKLRAEFPNARPGTREAAAAVRGRAGCR